MIIITMMISPFAMAIGGLVYDVIASLINTVPNKKYLNYSLKEQLFDIIPNLLLSGTMFGIVYLISFINMNVYLMLVIQIITGVVYFVLISKITKNECFNEIFTYLKEKLRRN